MSVKYSFIGVGNMASAIIRAMDSLEGKIITEHCDIYLYDKMNIKTDEYKKQGYKIAISIDECVKETKYIFLCVKPQNYREVLEYIKNNNISLAGKVIISVAAGISTSQITDCLGCECAVIRTMPNTPMTIGEGVTAICKNSHVESRDFERVCRIFSAKSELMVLDQSQMNNIIGITSSSPAYVYKFIDALYESAISQGLDSPKLLEAICKVMIGSAKMVLSSECDIKDLISAVRSPNGTTERALNVLDDRQFDKMINDAVRACNERADTLGEEM